MPAAVDPLRNGARRRGPVIRLSSQESGTCRFGTAYRPTPSGLKVTLPDCATSQAYMVAGMRYGEQFDARTTTAVRTTAATSTRCNRRTEGEQTAWRTGGRVAAAVTTRTEREREQIGGDAAATRGTEAVGRRTGAADCGAHACTNGKRDRDPAPNARNRSAPLQLVSAVSFVFIWHPISIGRVFTRLEQRCETTSNGK
jgi:hypothetical protein